MPRHLVGTLAALLLVFVALGLARAEEPDRVTLVQDHWPPYALGEPGRAPEGGIAVHLAGEIFRRVGVELEMKLLPWKRCLSAAKRGDVDGIALLVKNEEREAFLVYSQALVEDRDLLWFPASRGEPLEWETFADLDGLRLGQTAGAHYGEAFDAARKAGQIRVSEAHSDLINFQKLTRGRIDAFICNEAAARAIFAEHPELGEQVRSAGRPVKTVQLHFALSKRSAAAGLLPKVDAAITAMKADGALEALLGR
jgi:polar amino acid transport system substrate-binding protein